MVGTFWILFYFFSCYMHLLKSLYFLSIGCLLWLFFYNIHGLSFQFFSYNVRLDLYTTLNLSITMKAWWLKFRLPWGHGDWIFFTRHPHVAIERFLISTIAWWLNSVTIQRHQFNSITVKQWLCFSITANGDVGKFNRHLGKSILGWTNRNHLKEW
jgi:hypothetical protein